MGFYHMETKEAHNVLSKRIDRMIDQNEKMLSLLNGHCCSCLLRSQIDGIKGQLESHQNMRQIVSLRLSSSGPKQKLTLPDTVLQKAKSYDLMGLLRQNRRDDYYYSNAYLMSGGGGCGGGWYAIDDDNTGGDGGGGGDDGGAGYVISQ